VNAKARDALTVSMPKDAFTGISKPTSND
jgi:hypothetical protein